MRPVQSWDKYTNKKESTSTKQESLFPSNISVFSLHKKKTPPIMEGRALEFSLRTKYSLIQQIHGVSVWCQIRGVFPRSGLSSVPRRPHSSRGSTLTALVCAATAGAPSFIVFCVTACARRANQHSPRLGSIKKKNKNKHMLHVSSCIRCALF